MAVRSLDKERSWYREEGSDQINQESLRPALEVLRDRDQFKQRMLRFITAKGKDGSSYKVATTEEGLRRQIEELDIHQLKHNAVGNAEGASQALSTYNKERQTGAKKFGGQVQNFIKAFMDFTGVYSGIISLVKHAGQEYAEIAYEALSILFIVVVNKVDNDSKISTLLSDVQKSFPQLDILMEAYPSTTLEKCVASVYKEVILFSRKASEYFARFWVRLRMAFGSPPSMGIDVTIAIIHGKLAEVNSEAMVLLHSRSQEIHKGVQKLEAGVQKLQADKEQLLDRTKELKQQNDKLLQEMEQAKNENHQMRVAYELKNHQEDENTLEHFKTILGIISPCPEMDLATCRHGLLESFPSSNSKLSTRKPAFRFEQMTLELLSSEPSYPSWLSSSTSALLFLTGKTASGGRVKHSATYSWLSPAAVFVAEKQMTDKKSICIYYCCHPELRGGKHRVIDVLGSVIWAVLEWRPAVLRHWGQHLRTAVEKAQRLMEASKEREAIKAMVKVLRELAVEVQQEDGEGWVYIVIDRLDQCDCKIRTAMDELAELVTNDECRVKVMVVVDTAYMQGEWDLDELDRKLKERVKARVDWDQHRMTVFERSQENLKKLGLQHEIAV